MESKWTEYTLGDLGQIVTGKTPLKSEEGNFGDKIPFVTPRDLDGTRIVNRTERFLSEIGAQSVKNARIPANSVLVSCIGSDMGKAALIKEESVTNQQINAIIVDSKFDYNFVYYVLSTRKQEIHDAAGGSALPILNKTHFSQLNITLPPLPEQKAIAHILGSLDDKIELNRKMNATLEGMAQALFKSWFVDFDPVIDNALVAGNPIPEELADRAETRREAIADSTANREAAKLFPAAFHETEGMGWIPEGWDVGQIIDLADLDPESWSNKNHPNHVDYIDLANTKNGLINEVFPYKYSDAPSRARRVLRRDDTIIGTVRPGNRSFAYIHEEGLTGSTGFAVLRPKLQMSRTFLYLCLTQDDVIEKFAHLADGGAYPAIRPEVVGNREALIVNSNLMAFFDEQCYPMIEKIGQHQKAINTLNNLRDTLLPKLISGELRIEDAEKMVEVAR